VQAANNGPRLITGIAFDPKSPTDAPRLWVSHGQLVFNDKGEMVGASEWTGKISTLSGPQLADYDDVVVNLPRSFRDHLNNQISFGPDGCVYWSQGSHTAMGAPTDKWSMDRVERVLSAAILRLDPRKLPADKPLDAMTRDGGGAARAVREITPRLVRRLPRHATAVSQSVGQKVPSPTPTLGVEQVHRERAQPGGAEKGEYARSSF
jgi:hypothetical protein